MKLLSSLRARVPALALVVMLASLLTACMGDADTSAAEEAVRLRLEQLSRGEYAAVWQTLHPAHQALVSEQQFVECGRELALQRSPAIDSITVKGAQEATREFTGIGEVETITVEVEWTSGEDTRRARFDVIDVDGTWRWVISDSALNAYQSGGCPV